MNPAINLNNYYFKILDENDKIFDYDTVENNDSNYIRQVVIRDSIFYLYPYAQVTMNDIMGYNYLSSPFIERQKVSIEMGIYDSDIKIKPDFYWGRNIMTDVQLAKNIGGKVINTFLSYFKYKDEVLNKTYPASNPSTVARLIATSLGASFNKIFTTPAINTRNWYQGNNNYTSFITNVLGKYACSTDSTPFIAFFNLLGEFHFRSISSLFKPEANNLPLPRDNEASSLPSEYTIDFSDGKFTTRRNYVQQVFQLDFLGNEINHNLYSVEFTHVNSKKYVNKIEKIGVNKPISNDLYPLRYEVATKPLQNILLGYFNTKDIPSKDGLMRNHFLNTYFPLRMQVMIFFDPYQTSGKLIKIKTTDSEGNINDILSGEWLIVEATHSYNHVDGINNRVIYTTLSLAKSGLSITTKGKYMV